MYPRITNWLLNIELCMLSENIQDYYYVAQGKTTIPGMDDGEEFQLTDVRARKKKKKTPPSLLITRNSLNITPLPYFDLHITDNSSKR